MLAILLSKKIGINGANANKNDAELEISQSHGELSSWQEWDQSQWVIETIAEDMSLKREIFNELDKNNKEANTIAKQLYEIGHEDQPDRSPRSGQFLVHLMQMSSRPTAVFHCLRSGD